MKQTQLFRRVISLSLEPMMLLSLAACGKKPSPAADPVTAEQAITQVGNDSYIRLQQYYEGIPV